MSDIVLVTGGNGFLGQHIVRLLHQTTNNVKQIRVIDITPFKKKLDYEAVKPQNNIVADICNLDHMTDALKNVTCVFHVATYIRLKETSKTMKDMQRINVTGTQTVIDACIANQVDRLIYTSSIDAVCPLEHIRDADEDSLPYVPKSTLRMPAYGITKQMAEKIVLQANETLLDNDKVLHTLSIRPCGIYGELDRNLLTDCLRKSAKNGGKYVHFLKEFGKPAVHDLIYAGNAAWAHLCAMKSLQNNASSVAGKAYFVTDDTPREPLTFFQHIVLKNRGWSFSKIEIPWFITYMILVFLEMIIFIVKPIKEIHLPAGSHITLYATYNGTFSRKRAEKYLDYRPLYTYDQALDNSLVYYKTVTLKSKM